MGEWTVHLLVKTNCKHVFYNVSHFIFYIAHPPNGIFTVQKYSTPYYNKPGLYELEYTHVSSNVSYPEDSVVSYLIQVQRSDLTSVYYWAVSC